MYYREFQRQAEALQLVHPVPVIQLPTLIYLKEMKHQGTQNEPEVQATPEAALFMAAAAQEPKHVQDSGPSVELWQRVLEDIF